MSASAECTDDAADQLFSVAAYSDDDGRVTGEILDWGKTNTREGTPDVYVKILVPNGETFRQTFDWPANDSTDYEFVRLVEQVGWSLSSVDHLEGSKVKCERVDGDWQVYLEPRSTGFFRGVLVAGALFFGAVAGATLAALELGTPTLQAARLVFYQAVYGLGGAGIAATAMLWALDLFTGGDS